MSTPWRCLRHPRAQLYAFDARDAVRREIERGTWGWFAAIAVVGTILYEGSLRLVWSQWGGPKLLVSTALSWGLFGLALARVTRRRTATCAHACLVTMMYGMGVLGMAGAANLALPEGSLWSAAGPALSNVVMAIVLVRLLGTVGVPWWKTLSTWVLGLDGAGLILFYVLGGFQ